MVASRSRLLSALVCPTLTRSLAFGFAPVDKLTGVAVPVMEHQPVGRLVDETRLDERGQELLWVAGPPGSRRDFVRGHVTETTIRPHVVQAPPPEEVQVTDQRCAVDRQTTGGPQCLPVSCERLVTLNPCHGLRPPWPTHQKGTSSSPSPHSSPNSPPSSAAAACCSLCQSRKRTLSATTSVTHRVLPSRAG